MEKKDRILIVDTLRGFALLLIVLIHFVEHFDFFKAPEYNFLFSADYDSKVINTVFLLISGKAYSIFALLFGLSFFIQMDRKESQGINFKGRFLWRITILLIMGFLHSLVYRGDILHIYAILGIPLVILYRVNSKTLLLLSFLIVIQIPIIYELIQSFVNPDYQYTQNLKEYFAEGNEVYASGNFLDVVSYNFWKGRMTVWSWTIYNGRYLQLLTLFIIGMLLGRLRIFENVFKYRKALIKTLLLSIAGFLVFFYLYHKTIGSNFNDLQKSLLGTLIISFENLAITSFLISLIILLYIRFENVIIFRLFASYGKMSLSNYVFQAVFGVIFFYGFGLAMYKYLGSTWSLILGFIVFFTQAVISHYWNKKYYYGPLEWFWRSLTYFSFSIKIKREYD